MKNITTDRVLRKKRRIRAKVFGTQEIPKISVYRSNKYFYAQAIDDVKRVTLAATSSTKIGKKDSSLSKTLESKEVGKLLAEKLMKKGVKKAVLDRGPYLYLGRVKAFVEGLREAGLQI